MNTGLQLARTGAALGTRMAARRIPMAASAYIPHARSFSLTQYIMAPGTTLNRENVEPGTEGLHKRRFQVSQSF